MGAGGDGGKRGSKLHAVNNVSEAESTFEGNYLKWCLAIIF